MARIQSKFITFAFVWLVIAGMILLLAMWFFNRDHKPRTIVIATGQPGSLYDDFAKHLTSHIDPAVRVVKETTEGSAENRRMLRDGSADIALIQGDALHLVDDDVGSAEIVAIAPLFPEILHIIVPTTSDIQTLRDLDQQRVFMGPSASGSRLTSVTLLAHFRVQVEEPVIVDGDGDGIGNVVDLFANDLIDAAMMTTGTANPMMKSLLATGDYRLIGIPEAEAISQLSAHRHVITIPAGLYNGLPLVPAKPVITIATTAYLAARKDASPALVQVILPALYESSLRSQFPAMISRQDALSQSSTVLHETSYSYFHPIDHLESLKTVVESLVATKELLFAICAGMYLVWLRWRRMKTREEAALLHIQKEHLDDLLSKTLRIEKEQMKTSDAGKLQEMLDEVTKLKLSALEEVTTEELRADNNFSIFLQQCSSLIHKIQLKIVAKANPWQIPPEG